MCSFAAGNVLVPIFTRDAKLRVGGWQSRVFTRLPRSILQKGLQGVEGDEFERGTADALPACTLLYRLWPHTTVRVEFTHK